MAMWQYSANIQLSEMSFVKNVANYWRTFKRNFLNYSIASRLSKEVDTEYQTSIFLATIGQDVFDIYDGLGFDNEEDKMDQESVMNRLEDFFVSETREAFESYKFHHWKQDPSENNETYVASLPQLVKNSNFG